ncbi:unnamed protein product [Larinioides sclopetarius]|uniref:C2H2-type domain-containing protein n=1 Tax=Larinioides sclopetarius TaxID=280406 RepID=A0AAV2A492_9ARAC
MRHLRTHTDKFKCESCDKTCTRRHGLMRHLRSHTGEKPFRCENCTSTFSRRDILLRHQRRCALGGKCKFFYYNFVHCET